MLILCDLRFLGCLISGHTGFSLRFAAFPRQPALRAVCTVPPHLPADWAAHLYPAADRPSAHNGTGFGVSSRTPPPPRSGGVSVNGRSETAERVRRFRR